MKNKYKGVCEECGGDVEAGKGTMEKVNGKWIVRHAPLALTDEQKQKMENGIEQLTDEVYRTQEPIRTYPTLPDGRKDFRADPINTPLLTREEVRILVERFYELWLQHRMSKQHAQALTYADCYAGVYSHRTDPRKRVQEILASKASKGAK